MAVVQTTALVILLLISIYNVKRCAFIGSDVVGLTVEGSEIIRKFHFLIIMARWGPERYTPELNNVLKGKGIGIFHQNVRGLLSNSGQVAELLHSFKAIDIILSRKDRKGGGVGAYISDRLVWERRRDIEHERVLNRSGLKSS